MATSADTPLRADAFELSDSEKIEIVEDQQIMITLGLDLNDDIRLEHLGVARMYVEEIFQV